MRRTEDVMGMPITVDVRDPSASAGVVDDIYADLVRIDRLFSPFLPESEISRIRDGRLAVDHAGPLVHATSGTYEKGTHIYDPHTGAPATDLLSMTVVGPSILEADVSATAAFAMGLAGLEFIERHAGYDAYAIDRELRGHWTTGFDDYCEQNSGVT